MKLPKQLLHIFSEKTFKIGQYRNLVSALLTVVVWLSTITTSFAYTNIEPIDTFNSSTLQSSVENIAPRQLFPKEATHFLADTSSLTDESNIFQSNPLINILQAFQEAWKQPDKKESLFNVCRKTEVDTSICLNLLKNEIKTKKQKLIDSCYKTTGRNGELCLYQTLKQLGLKLSDFDRWINDLEQVSD